MAINRFISLCLLSYLIFFCTSLSSSSVSAQKVSLALYYETLCPYCSSLIVNGLSKIFGNGLIDIIDLTLSPYGNARVGSNGTITCQHGPNECLLNTVEACALYVWPDLNTHFTFIYCIESLVVEGKYRQWESCFEKTGLDSRPIADCYNSGLGKKLELQYAAQTNALEPPHQYVPWVVVDGQPLYEDYNDFIIFVCKAYKGAAVPKACKELPVEIVTKAKANQNHQVCFAEEPLDSASASASSATAPTKIRSRVSSGRRQMKMVTPEKRVPSSFTSPLL